jgi:hypothetical protein
LANERFAGGIGSQRSQSASGFKTQFTAWPRDLEDFAALGSHTFTANALVDIGLEQLAGIVIQDDPNVEICDLGPPKT